MLTMRARRFLQRTGRNLGANGTTSRGFDMSKCNGVGSYDWSFRADEEPTNYALMEFTSSISSSFDNDVAPYYKACTKAYATLQSYYDKLTVDFRKSQFDVLIYKSGLKYVKARLVVHQHNENVFEKDIKLLKINVMLSDNALVELRKKFEAAEKKDELKLKLENFQSSSKNLNVSMPTSPVHDRYKSGEGYHDVPPPYTGTFMPSKPDLVFHDVSTVSETVPTVFNVKPSTTKPTKDMSQSNRPSAPIIEDWVSDSEDESEVEHHTQAKNLRNDIPKSRVHRHSWNRKACFVCKSVNHLIKDYDCYKKNMVQKHVWNHAMRVSHQNYARITYPHSQKHVVPTSVLTRSRLIPLNAARPVTTAIQVSHGLGPQKTLTFLFDVHGNSQQALKDKRVIDSGFSRHMTGNISYLSEFEAINGGYVAFGGNPKGGKITSKGKIRTGKLDFNDVYFVKELKFNLFSVSQMCDKKNIVLFIDTECVVLSSDFKLSNENHVLLRVPRENNTYNVDLKNILPSEDLTCLFVKATLDESNLWHRRPGHINFKTMNKLVKERKNRTLIEAARTMLADSLLPIPFWAEAVNTACYVQNMVLVTKPHNKTPYELLLENLDAGKVVKEAESAQQYVLLPLWSTGSKDPQNTDADAAFDDKENESGVHISPSSSDKPKKHDEKAKREAKGKNDEEDVGAATDFSNLETSITVSLIPTTRVQKDHLVTKIIGDLSSAPQTRSMATMVKEQGRLTQINDEDFHTCMFAYFLSQEEPKRVHQALKDPSWIEAIQEELLQFKMQKVWGHTQEEGIDYEEVFAQVARIEAIRLFLVYASFMGFMIYQMDVKSDFLYGTIKEEMYIYQPPRFKDPDYPDKVYKVVKELYELHQAPRAWYETLANYLLENGFQRGKIDQTLFIKKQKGDILLVRVYVDDIIFGSTNKELCKAFEKLMKDKFQMSSMGELTFFLGLQVKQKDNGIFISQDKYVAKILRKFGLTDVKRFFKYLKGKPQLDLWYPKDSPFNLVAYSDSDYAGASLDRKSTTVGCQFLGCRLISWQCKKQTVVATSSNEAKYVVAASYCAQSWLVQKQTALGKDESNLFIVDSLLKTIWSSMHLVIAMKHWLFQGKRQLTSVSIKKSNDVARLQALIDRKKVIIIEDTIRQALRLDDVDGTDCLPNEEIFAELARMGYEKPKYTSPALTQKVFANMRRIGKGFSGVDTSLFDGMLVQQQVQAVKDAAEDKDDDNEVSAEPTPPSPTLTVNISQSALTLLNTLLETCATLTKKVANLEQDKISQAIEITKLKQRVRRCIQTEGGIVELDADEDVNLVDAEEDVNADVQRRLSESQAKVYHLDLQHTEKVLSMQDTDEAEPAEVEKVIEVVTAAKLMTKVVTTAATTITAAQVPKASALRIRKGVVIQNHEEIATASVIVHSKLKSKDKGKEILIEEPKPLKRQAQIEKDEAFVRQLEAELNANINWDDVMEQVKTREKPDNTVMRYQALKRKPHYNFIKAFLDKGKKEIEEEGSKRKGDSLNQDAAKKQRIDEETGELKTHLQIVANDYDDVYTEATPLALKVPVVDYQIHYKYNKPYYKIIRAYGTHQLFLRLITLLKNFDKEDLEMLWKLVQERFQSSEPKKFSDDFLLNTFKIMYEKPNVEASIWRDQKGRYGLAKVKSWKLFESYRVHIITFTTTQMILLVEKKYPLTHFTLEQMLNNGFPWSIKGTLRQSLRFDTIITSLKALDKSFSSRNHVRKFLRALPTKWRPKVMTIEESKDLSTLPLDELIGKLKVYEVILEKDLEISRNKKEKYKSLALKARKVLSEKEVTSLDSNDEEYAIAVRDFKKFFRRRETFVRPPHDDKRCWSDSEDDSKKKEICLMALDDNEHLPLPLAFKAGYVLQTKLAKPVTLHNSRDNPNTSYHVQRSNNIPKDKKINFKRTARMSVYPPRLVSPPYDYLSPPIDYQTALPSTSNPSPSLFSGISPSKLLVTQKSTPPLLTSSLPAPTQPSKHSSPLAINIDPIELLFYTPPTSPQAIFDTLEDLPPTTTNPPPLMPSFDSIEHMANKPPPLPNMELPLPPLPPQFPISSPLKLSYNPFPMLTHKMFCELCQRTQVVIDNLRDEMRRGITNYSEEKKRSIDELYEVFVETIRLKFSSLKAKLTMAVTKAQLNWNIKMVKMVNIGSLVMNETALEIERDEVRSSVDELSSICDQWLEEIGCCGRNGM
nr:putative ribonuclease H-like domain-containing protein [Tanacetum cinerariifolium]